MIFLHCWALPDEEQFTCRLTSSNLYLILKQGPFLSLFFVRPDKWVPLVSLCLCLPRFPTVACLVGPFLPVPTLSPRAPAPPPSEMEGRRRRVGLVASHRGGGKGAPAAGVPCSSTGCAPSVEEGEAPACSAAHAERQWREDPHADRPRVDLEQRQDPPRGAGDGSDDLTSLVSSRAPGSARRWRSWPQLSYPIGRGGFGRKRRTGR
jgi:hypothetical protein